jgi:hypothetical protein
MTVTSDPLGPPTDVGAVIVTLNRADTSLTCCPAHCSPPPSFPVVYASKFHLRRHTIVASSQSFRDKAAWSRNRWVKRAHPARLGDQRTVESAR